mmetsp:Transcript_7024/g.10069  ORF Transcript_7024/g.10069 Transcript_7024/m.10069 type:complete len:206 (+) Transcript_7024:3437-4054(+)
MVDAPDVTDSEFRRSVRHDALRCELMVIITDLESTDVGVRVVVIVVVMDVDMGVSSLLEEDGIACGKVGPSMVRRARQVAESLKKMGLLVASMETALMVMAYDFCDRSKSVSIFDLSKGGYGYSSVMCCWREESISRKESAAGLSMAMICADGVDPDPLASRPRLSITSLMTPESTLACPPTVARPRSIVNASSPISSNACLVII